MTYQKLFRLKFKEHISTLELSHRYPHDRQKVTDLALLELSDSVLRGVLKDDLEYARISKLKQTFFPANKLRSF